MVANKSGGSTILLIGIQVLIENVSLFVIYWLAISRLALIRK